MAPNADGPDGFDTFHLETDRLLLRPRTPHDAAIMHALWSQRDPRVPPHRRIGPDGRPSLADLQRDLRARTSPTATSIDLLAIERKDGRDVVGYCGLVDSGRGAPGEPELAFEVLREQRGRGYATEAGRAVVDWARESGRHRLWATVWDWNAPSRRVLATLGFTETDRTEVDPERGTTLFTTLVL